MFKTYIDIPRRDYIYYMVHDIITLRNGWDVLTTVYKPHYVRFYFSYKWFQYGKVRAFKKAVKNYAKRVTYYDRTSIPRYLFAQETISSSDKLQKALAEFSYTSAVQGGIRCGDIEAIVIGYKKIRRN
jgi:hypothetical protein